ncbi:SDR family oxidoreductase [Actinomyces respiraculi]|uniref:SDR family oxidoreductase n=1 Tax=Actinomyces respiraculi TaxID=2744574 RepID=UPI00141FE822|nr:SDR family oxidoreductase [Actinomyces respiraculi]
MSAPAGLLTHRTILVTGVLRPRSIAAAVARTASEQGARVLLTGHPRTLRLTQHLAAGLGVTDPVLPLDVADAASLDALPGRLAHMGVERVNGLVHAVAHTGRDLLGDALAGSLTAHPADASGPTAGSACADVLSRRLDALAAAGTVSAASLAALVGVLAPMLGAGSSVVTLTFTSERVMPGYGWMGPIKAALEASVRGLAVELGPAGVRVNAVCSGPLRTPAAGAVPGLEALAATWQERAPLGWEADDAAPVARTVVSLLSDWLPATTGQVVRADGGMGLLGV